MSHLITIYPRLYTTRSLGSGVVTSTGDITVTTLYQFLLDRTVNTVSWDYRKRVLATAMRMFGDFDQWLKDQRNNPQLVGFNFDFLVDTLQFIRTGNRQMAVANWLEIVGESVMHSNSPNHLPGSGLSLDQSETTNALIQQWCSWPNGIEDLLCTLYVLFGPARDKLA